MQYTLWQVRMEAIVVHPSLKRDHISPKVRHAKVCVLTNTIMTLVSQAVAESGESD